MAAVMVANADSEFLDRNFSKAADLYTQCLDSCTEEDQLDLLRKRCSCLFEIGNYSEALEDTVVYNEKNPDSTFGYNMAGKCLTKMKKFEDALHIYKQGLKIDPKNVQITEGLKQMQDAIISTYEARGETTYDAVKMSSMESYPGDEELERLEREILEKWGLNKFPDISMQVNNPNKAIKMFKSAIDLHKAGNTDMAVEKLKSALEFDPANFGMWAEAAVFLHKIGRHKMAYQYCQVIPRDFRTVKEWKIGGQILNDLELPVLAEGWLRQAHKLSRKDEEIALLFQKIRVRRLYDPLSAGTKVHVTFTQFGRSVVANQPVTEVNEVVMRDPPSVLCQTLESQRVVACSNCAKCLMWAEDYFSPTLLSKNADLRKIVKKHWPRRDRIPCEKCSRAVYCSTECRTEAWDRYHQVLCPSFNPAVEKLYEICDQYSAVENNEKSWAGVWNASFSPLLLASIWACIICEARKLAKAGARDTPSTEDWDMAKAPYRRFIAYGSSSNSKVIPKMFKLMQEVFSSPPDGWRYTVTQREFDGRYFQATCNAQAFSDARAPFNVFINNIQNEPYCDMIRMLTTKDPEEANFAGLFPLHACMNHSCDNNVEVIDSYVDGRPGVAVRSKRPIKVGEEVMTTYINTGMPRRERRAWLFRAYNFWCQCRRCQFEGDGPERCTTCGKKVEDTDKGRFPACGKCHRAWYCSTACQKDAWKKGHKAICSTPHSNTYSPSDKYMKCKLTKY